MLVIIGLLKSKTMPARFSTLVPGVIFGLGGIGDVTGVRDGGLHDAPGLARGIHAELDVRQVVEGIKDAENVHALFHGEFTEPEMERKQDAWRTAAQRV